MTQFPRRAIHCLTAALLMAAASTASAQPITVTLDTTAVAGTSGKLVFDFTSSNANANLITIQNFTSDAVLGLPETQGGLVTGDIILVQGGMGMPAASTTIEDDFFFNQLAVVFNSFGSQVTFQFSALSNYTPGAIPDELAFFILRSDNKPLVFSDDPLGSHALFTLCIDGTPTGNLMVFPPAMQPAADQIMLVVVAGVDTDGDGIPDEDDLCTVGDDAVDTDEDGISDGCDNCPFVPNNDQANNDGDSAGDVCDECDSDPNKIVVGACGCDMQETDDDGDGVANCVDNCPQNANPDQVDSDGDAMGDACDLGDTGMMGPCGMCGTCGAGLSSFVPIILFSVWRMRRSGRIARRFRNR